MKRVKLIVLAALVAVTGVFSTLQVSNALADDTGSSSALSIAPKKNYLIEPGKSVDDTLTVRNLDDTEDLTLTLRVIDFSYTGDDGTPKLLLDQNAPQTTWSLKSYLTVPETVTIPAGASKQVPISVAMPANLGAGSYYSAVLYSTGAPNGGNVGLAASGVTLVFVSVPGLVNENLALQKFGAYHEKTSTKDAGYSFITATMPLTLGYTLKNEGNVTESPVGSIKLKYMFGQETDINDINPVGSLALIGQTRTFTACIKLKTVTSNSDPTKNTCVDPGLWPGMYTASLDAFYGQNGNNTQEIVKNATFWYLPWWFVITFLIVLIIVAFFVWRVVVRIQSAFGGGSKRPKRRAPFRRR
jgi:hypothetical protein